MKSAVFFDIDHTLLNGETQKLLAIYLFKKGKLSLFFVLKTLLWYLLYKLGITANKDSVEAGTKTYYQALKGWPVRDFEDLIADFFEQELKPRIFKQARAIIQKHQQQELNIVLLSGSMEFLAKLFAKELDIKYYRANRIEQINGIFTGRVEEPFVWGQSKIDAAKKLALDNNWSLKDSYVYTDHFSDIPLLEIVGHPNVVNPKRELISEANKRNWPILIWQ